MDTPHVTEMPPRLEVVEHDPFIDDLPASATEPRPAPAERPRNARRDSRD